MAKQKLVMIGNGMAGLRTIEEILERSDSQFDITIIGKEPYPNYNRIMLSNILQKKMTVEETIMNTYDWYKEHHIELIVDDPVEKVDRQSKTVTTSKGITVTYDICIFATGSKAFVLPIPGSELPSVIGWRTIEDTERMIEIAKTKRRAIVIGGGLLGLECARGLMDQGMDVTVLHLAEWLMEMQLDRKAGDMLKADLERQGMHIELQANSKEIIGTDDVEAIKLADGRVIETDLVVMAVGIRPFTEVAREAGLEVNRGIVVNDYLQTSDEHIYAVGECAEHNGKVYGLVAPLYEQGKVLADYLTGKETEGYKGSTTFTSLKVSGCDLYSAGQIGEILKCTLGDEFVAAKPTGICACTDLTRDEIVTQIRAKGLKTSKEVRHVLDFKDKNGCPKCRPAINYYLNMVYPHEHQDEKASRFANERYHANIQNDGTFSVIPQMRGGVTDADQLIRLGEVAKKYNVPLVKVTGSQRVGLYGLKKDELPEVWKDLGMRSASAYGKKTRSVKSCVGKEFCRFGTQYTTRLGIRLEKTFEYIDTPHKFKMGVSGCPRSCVESGVKDFGVISVENGYQIYIGGNGGTEVTVGQLLTTVETEDQVVQLCGALMQYYRETGIYAERTAPWLKRLGFDHVKEVLLDEQRQKELFDRIMDAKQALEEEPWEAIVENKEAQKIFEVEKV
ncbi:NAD(P)/FAD-dependent oxidoreductase [Staphylococcus hominis]|uniref:NAD(P)/FAD-dependent oxidoreductase n=1 Tax=Staphylococcus hominis TaxID=1290 RepID=UPI002878D8B1|nr:NAD(P)/FAD-dependent oxidoreductase [Staphylococcus hominis]MDS3909089.1 NAD(P)/FAD-dependent oxidoreductase [Staphylococcus hominis]